jgi:hypothetical protein
MGKTTKKNGSGNGKVAKVERVQNAKDVAKSVVTGIGAMVWWDLFATDITPASLRSVLASEGLQIDVPDIDDVQAIKVAAAEWSEGTRKRSDRYWTEVVYEDAAQIEVGVLRHGRVDEHEVNAVQVDRVMFDRIAGQWLDTGSTQQAASFIEAANNRRANLDHRFITPKIVQAELDACQAFNLRRMGGIVFVPSPNLDRLERLQRVVRLIGSSEFHIAHVEATESSRASIAASAEGSIGGALDDLVGRLDAWSESSRRISEVSTATVLGEFADLRTKARLYASCLEVSLDDLMTKITDAESRAREIIDGQPVFTVSESKPREATVERCKMLVAMLPNGVGEVTMDQVLNVGFGESATKYQGVWHTAHSAGIAMLSIGKLAALKKTENGQVLVIRNAGSIPAPKTEQTERTEPPKAAEQTEQEEMPRNRPTLAAQIAACRDAEELGALLDGAKASEVADALESLPVETVGAIKACDGRKLVVRACTKELENRAG